MLFSEPLNPQILEESHAQSRQKESDCGHNSVYKWIAQL